MGSYELMADTTNGLTGPKGLIFPQKSLKDSLDFSNIQITWLNLTLGIVHQMDSLQPASSANHRIALLNINTYLFCIEYYKRENKWYFSIINR